MNEEPQSHSICALPWMHLATTVDGVWGRCCFDATNDYGSYYHEETEPKFELHADALGCSPKSRFARDNPGRVFDMVQAFNSPQMRRTRLQMLNGEQPQACEACYAREREGLSSHRLTVNAATPSEEFEARVVQTAADGRIAQQPTYLDFRFGNKCNLACVMCGFPTTSRQRGQVQAWARSPIDPLTDDELFWAQLEAWAPGLRLIYFAGGEPFLQAGHDRAIDLFLKTGTAPKIELRYNSNLTVLPRAGFARLREFRRVEISASCDGVGGVYETIRVGGKWDVFVQNARTARREVEVLLDVTVQIANIGGLADLIHFAWAEDLPIRLENFVDDPPHLSLRALSEAEVRAHSESVGSLVKECERRGDISSARQLEGIIAYMQWRR